MNKNKFMVLSLLAGLSLPMMAQTDSTDIFVNQPIDIGADMNFTREQSTAAVSVITNKHIDRRSAKNIGNSILGQGLGVQSLQSGAGRYAAENPTFYVRGLQTLNGNTSPLILVDGIERDIASVTPEEVESVSILKDAAAVALYGYKGINGAIQITTKRGQYGKSSVKFTYDHVFKSLVNKPKFVDAYTYANAINEARANDGLSARYSAQEVNAFKTGNYPYLYPNVNWVDETFRDNGMNNKFNLQFEGGSGKFRYYTMVDLISDKGFINNLNSAALFLAGSFYTFRAVFQPGIALSTI